MFGSLWESQSHGSNKPVLILCFAMLVCFIAIPVGLHFIGNYGILFIIPAMALLVAIIVVARKNRWNNPKLIFSLTENGIYFTSSANPNSYFSAEYSEIKGYSFVADGGFTTVTVYFNGRTYAGVFGNIDKLKMVKIERFELLRQVFSDHGINAVEETK